MRGDVLPTEYELSPNEVDELLVVIKRLRQADENPGSPTFYDRHWVALEQVPIGLRRFLDQVRRCEHSAASLVRGFPVDNEAIGPTPGHWELSARTPSARDYEIYLALCGMCLGEPFTWATLQAGRIVQDVVPIPGDEQRQNGYGSAAALEFHTEDGFRPDRCDYLLLLGLRNDDRVPTTVASIRDVELSEQERQILSERRFYIVPDDEHIRQWQARNPDHPALREALRMRDRPEPVAVLFGSPDLPYLRLDRPFMSCVGGDAVAERALDRLMAELGRVQRAVVVEAGTLLVVDNYAGVHGRGAFRSRYDGTDRWLKKLTVRRDLRRGSNGGTASHRVLM
jgi:Fe(II)/alpha-ketoglutarate-dependent arginine beta-hydroxylase